MDLISKSLLMLFVTFFLVTPGTAETGPSQLPEPLTLEYVLSLADEAHPDLLLKDAELLEAEARRKEIESDTGLDIDLDVGVYATDNDSVNFARRRDHMRAGVILTQTFYDFGRTNSLLAAVEELRHSRELAYHDARGQRRLQIMSAYFDVLLADLKFSLYNESMAVGYVNFDKARDRRELGQRTDLDVIRREAEYQKLRVARYQSENQQRETRARLAEVLNRPGQLPATLSMPKLMALKNKLPEVELLQQQASEKNLHLNALRHEVMAAEKDLRIARDSPELELKGRVEAFGYDSEIGTTDEVSAELSLVYNFVRPDQDAQVAAALTQLYATRAQLQKSESELRQQILSLWHQAEELSVQREAADVLLQLKELELEQSRALYEMEVKADLGFSMTELTEAQLNSAQTDYQLELVWYKLDLLTANIEMDMNHRVNHPQVHPEVNQ